MEVKLKPLTYAVLEALRLQRWEAVQASKHAAKKATEQAFKEVMKEIAQ